MNIRAIVLLFLTIHQITFGSLPSLSNLTVEEKVGQLLIVHFHGTKANDYSKILIQQAHVGGFIYFNWSNGLQNPKQVLTLSHSLQQEVQKKENPIPLILSIDQEGGVVSRLKKGFTVFPGNRAIALTRLPLLAEKSASATAKELLSVGINMILGPVVDVNTNPLNPVIGVRSYSSSPKEVVTYALKALHGYKKTGIIPVIKHFPGHGDVSLDSHLDLPIVNKPYHQIVKTELYPFEKLNQEVDCLMTAHLLVPALDPFHCATLSKTILQDILRKRLGYKGIIISDSLVMKGFLNCCSDLVEASIQAIEAGCDMLILGGKQLLCQDGYELNNEDILKIYHSIVEAVYSGRISEERLDASVSRILSLKERYLTKTLPPSISDLPFQLNTPEHKKLAREIAHRAQNNQTEQTKIQLNFHELNVALFAPKLIQYDLNSTTLASIGKETKTLFFEKLNPSASEQKKAEELVDWAEAVVVCAYNAWKNSEQVKFIQSLAEKKKPVSILVLRDPQDLELVKGEGYTVITTFSPDRTSIQHAVDILTGAIHAHSPNPYQ